MYRDVLGKGFAILEKYAAPATKSTAPTKKLPCLIALLAEKKLFYQNYQKAINKAADIAPHSEENYSRLSLIPERFLPA